MSRDTNIITITGRLTRDPELRYTPSGTAVASFTLANNNSYTTNGEKVEKVSYIDCTAWGKTGEIITEYCKKGKKILVSGRLELRRWDDQDGNKKSKIEIVVSEFEFMSGGEKHEPSDADKVSDAFESDPFA